MLDVFSETGLKGIVHPQNLNSVIAFSPLCCSKYAEHKRWDKRW